MHILHLISHTHWDREWYLPFQNFRLKLVHLVDNLLDLLDKDPEYRYFMLDGQTVVLEDYLEMRPEKEAELRAHIQSGRVLIGPWHILPDEFLVSPEATVRNLLQGERTSRRFGARMKVGYIPDPFGHIGQMPQILRGFGIQYASVQRGLSDQPCEFWWQSPDGSRVFMGYLRDSYANATLLLNTKGEEFVAEVQRERDSLLPHAKSSHILLMQGNDHTEASPQTSANIDYANQHLDGDRLVHSTLPDSLAAAQAQIIQEGIEIPTILGELRESSRHNLLPAVLSTRVWIKQRNHACETLLEKWAEPFSTFASLFLRDESAGTAPVTRINDPAPILRQAWHQLMACHPHDSICGCSVDQVHQEMGPRFDQVEQIGEEITRQSLESLAAWVDTQKAAANAQAKAAIVVFNPTNQARTDVVSTKLQIPNGSNLQIVDAAGEVMPHKIGETETSEVANLEMNREEFMVLLASVQEGKLTGLGAVEGMAIQDVDFQRNGDTQTIFTTLSNSGEPNDAYLAQAMSQVMVALGDETIQKFILHGRTQSTQVDFVARDVPAFGWQTYWVQPATAVQEPKRNSQPLDTIENEFFSVQVFSSDGTLTLMDKRSGTVLHGLNRFLDGGDRGDTYNYCPPAEDQVIQGTVQSISYAVDDTCQSLTVKLELMVPSSLGPDRLGRSDQRVPVRIITRASLVPGVPRLDIHTQVDNTAQDHRLRVHFPASFSLAKAGFQAAYDGHFEVVERSTRLPEYDDTWLEAPRPEQPQRTFCDVSNGKTGLMVANRGLREVEVFQNENGETEIALTLLRCIGWLSRDDFPCRRVNAGPILPTPEAQMVGKWTFDYSLIPHSGGWLEAFQDASAFNAPLRAMVTGDHPGKLPALGSFIHVTPKDFAISAIKTSEDGSGWVVRGYNLGSDPIQARLRPWRSFQEAEHTNLAEEPLEKLVPEADGSFTIPIQGHQIATVKLGWDAEDENRDLPRDRKNTAA